MQGHSIKIYVYLKVPIVILTQVDWDACVESGKFGTRSRQNLREHWQRRLYPALVMETDIKEMMEFRRRLLQEIRKQGATIRNDIDWDKLEKIFKPKTKALLVKFLKLKFLSM